MVYLIFSLCSCSRAVADESTFILVQLKVFTSLTERNLSVVLRVSNKELEWECFETNRINFTLSLFIFETGEKIIDAVFLN